MENLSCHVAPGKGDPLLHDCIKGQEALSFFPWRRSNLNVTAITTADLRFLDGHFAYSALKCQILISNWDWDKMTHYGKSYSDKGKITVWIINTNKGRLVDISYHTWALHALGITFVHSPWGWPHLALVKSKLKFYFLNKISSLVSYCSFLQLLRLTIFRQNKENF